MKQEKYKIEMQRMESIFRACRGRLERLQIAGNNSPLIAELIVRAERNYENPEADLGFSQPGT